MPAASTRMAPDPWPTLPVRTVRRSTLRVATKRQDATATASPPRMWRKAAGPSLRCGCTRAIPPMSRASPPRTVPRVRQTPAEARRRRKSGTIRSTAPPADEEQGRCRDPRANQPPSSNKAAEAFQTTPCPRVRASRNRPSAPSAARSRHNEARPAPAFRNGSGQRSRDHTARQRRIKGGGQE
jgi:hypothetical protein